MKLFPTEIERCGDCPFAQVLSYDSGYGAEPMLICRKMYLMNRRVTENGYVRGMVGRPLDDCVIQPDSTHCGWCSLPSISKEVPSEVLYNNMEDAE